MRVISFSWTLLLIEFSIKPILPEVKAFTQHNHCKQSHRTHRLFSAQ